MHRELVQMIRGLGRPVMRAGEIGGLEEARLADRKESVPGGGQRAAQGRVRRQHPRRALDRCPECTDRAGQMVEPDDHGRVGLLPAQPGEFDRTAQPGGAAQVHQQLGQAGIAGHGRILPHQPLLHRDIEPTERTHQRRRHGDRLMHQRRMLFAVRVPQLVHHPGQRPVRPIECPDRQAEPREMLTGRCGIVRLDGNDPLHPRAVAGAGGHRQQEAAFHRGGDRGPHRGAERVGERHRLVRPRPRRPCRARRPERTQQARHGDGEQRSKKQSADPHRTLLVNSPVLSGRMILSGRN